ncbi:uncharacterized protein V1510DRAFT_181875 [Dipodascopsis tothii]|uniref:uncharacterized protein n=1 Tax=Dipodascopsis tothii TaxID=44089 RepID=UPI0034CEC715
MSDSKAKLAVGIIDFLQTSIADGTVAEDDRDSVEVAIDCLKDVFNVDGVSKEDVYGSQNLLSVYQAFEKVKAAAAPAAAAAPEPAALSDADKAKAEGLKGEGNRHMAGRNYEEAIKAYTSAIAIDGANPIYLSNRAAAYSASQQHELAVADAERALEADPKFSKAYSRLGLAKFALGDSEAAMNAYKKGIEVEGNGGSEVMRRGYETAKTRFEEEARSAVPEAEDDQAPATTGARGMPDLSSLAGMFGGGGGGSGPGGLDFASLMNNPQIANMAQQFMSNPNALQGLMNNPSIRNMAERMGSGNMPSMQEMMSDPNIANMARNFMGGNNGGTGN